VSSAILYLAIIAIWAGFLIPAWVRRPHAAPATSYEQEDEVAGAHPSEQVVERERVVEFVTETESDVEYDVEADVRVEVTRHEERYYAHEAGPGAGPGAGHGYSGQEHGDEVPDCSGDGAAHESDDYAEAGQPPSQTREQMLRARRRMLTILAAMTLVTLSFTVLGLVNWWICVPPAGMLVLYVLLLREIAMADAELARKRATWEAAQARAYARHLQAQAEWEAYEASMAESGAEIIDISGRVSDQLYDQYADAAVRAVGD
jgi:hypothetical protein